MCQFKFVFLFSNKEHFQFTVYSVESVISTEVQNVTQIDQTTCIWDIETHALQYYFDPCCSAYLMVLQIRFFYMLNSIDLYLLFKSI